MARSGSGLAYAPRYEPAAVLSSVLSIISARENRPSAEIDVCPHPRSGGLGDEAWPRGLDRLARAERGAAAPRAAPVRAAQARDRGRAPRASAAEDRAVLARAS